MADDEPVVIASSSLTMVLYRHSDNKELTTIEKTDFILPSFRHAFKELGINGSDVVCKFVLFKTNPYTWHKSSSAGNVNILL